MTVLASASQNSTTSRRRSVRQRRVPYWLPRAWVRSVTHLRLAWIGAGIRRVAIRPAILRLARTCLVLSKVDADLAPPRSGQPPGRCPALLIFIRQGWPQATGRLRGFCTLACSCRIASSTCANNVPLETVVNRSTPVACGPNVDHDHDEHRSDQGQADLGTLSVELVAVVDQTMPPMTASLWLRPGSLPCSGWPVSQDDGSRGVPTEAGRADTRAPRRSLRR
jgi:hypothetical protein